MGVTYPIQFRERLKAIMEERGMTQTAVAKAIGVLQLTVSNWVTGKHEPSAYNIVAMCVLFGVSADWLLGMDRIL